MNLTEHAENELELINCSEPEMTTIVNIVREFDGLGLNADGTEQVIEIVNKLFRNQNLSSLTASPGEWELVLPVGAPNEPAGLWQSVRRPSTYSRDQGKTWYDTDDDSMNNGDVRDRQTAEWAPVMVGNNVKLGSLVRVKVDGYKVRSAVAVNGLNGRVTAIRNGYIAVLHDTGQMYNHQPDLLEVRKE